MNRGIVLKKQTTTRKIHPIIFLLRISAFDLLKLSQIYAHQMFNLDTTKTRKKVCLRYPWGWEQVQW